MSLKTIASISLKKVIILAIAFGVFLRFYNLDRQVYWYDETMTSLRISGYTKSELVERVETGEPTAVEAFRNIYQYPNPSRDLKDTIDALARHPEHSPLYYLMARFWLQVFEPSVATIRSLSAWISLLVLPATYWLAKELFANPIAPGLSVAIVALSPFHILYGKEAREYSLWTVAILLSCAALLKAIRVSKVDGRDGSVNSDFILSFISSWGIYGITVALGLYAHPFSAFVSLSHGIYISILTRWKPVKIILAYFIASLFGICLFLPWLQIAIANFSYFIDNTISTTNPRDNLHLIWGLNLSRIFFDVNQGTSLLNPLLYIIIGLVGYAMYWLCRHARSQTFLFILLLMGVTGLALIGPDIVVGGRRSNNLRYAIPCVLGIQLAIAYLFATKLTALPHQISRWKFWKLGFFSLLFLGLSSGIVSSQLEVWWHKSYAKSRYNPAIARIINQTDRSIVLTDELPEKLLSLSHLLKPDVRLVFSRGGTVPDIPTEFSQVYLYRPSEVWKQRIEETSGGKIERAYKGWLWQLER